MHGEFTIEDWRIARGKADHGRFAWLEDYDIFPYDSPLRSTSSNYSGMLSVATCIIMFISLVSAFSNLAETQYTYSSTLQEADTPNDTPLPELYLVVKDINDDYFYDESYYSWQANFVSIYDSNTDPQKPKSKVPLVVERCEFYVSTDRVAIQALCVKSPSVKLVVEGRYENDLYEYVELSLIPCIESNTTTTAPSNIKCANVTSVEKTIFTDSISFSLWTYGYRTAFDMGWDSIVYRNTERSWQGTEVYFQRQTAARRNVFQVTDYINHWMSFDGYTLRTRPLTYNTDGTIYGSSVVKLYLRARDTEMVETIVQYGFIDFIEQIGGTWSIMTLTVGSLALYLNKKRYDRNIFDTSKFSQKVVQDTNKNESPNPSSSNDQKLMENPLHKKGSTNSRDDGNGSALDMELNLQKPIKSQRRFSSLPLNSNDDAAAHAERVLDDISRSSLILNSSGAFSSQDARKGITTSTQMSSQTGGYLTIFTTKEIQSIFSAGVEAPTMPIPLLQASLSKILRSHRMLPLSNNEMKEALKPYIPQNEPTRWVDYYTGNNNLITFPTYTELIVRLNDVVNMRKMKKGTFLIKEALDKEDSRGNVLTIEYKHKGLHSSPKHWVTPDVGRLYLEDSDWFHWRQEIVAEMTAGESGNHWCFKDSKGRYLSYGGESTQDDANGKLSPDCLKFNASQNGATEQFRLHFCVGDPNDNSLVISTNTEKPYYIAKSNDSKYLQLLPRKSDNEHDLLEGDAGEVTWQFFLPYCDFACDRRELEALCRNAFIQ